MSAPSSVEDPEGMLVQVPFDWPEAKAPVPAKKLPLWERGMDSELAFEEFTRAESIALFDYMRKAHSRGYVVSLSGGARTPRPARPSSR